MRIFVVAGKAESGKGEVSRLIKEYYTYKMQETTITEYSKYLKGFAMELTDWDGNPNSKPRAFLQELGDKIRRYDNKFFINRMLEDLKLYEDFVDNVVVDGARFPEEIDDIKANFPEVYSIYVENQHGYSKLTIAEQAHITETALEGYTNFDYVLANDKLEVLKEKVFKYLDGVK